MLSSGLLLRIQFGTEKCFFSLSILTATWSTVNITFACHQLVSPSASLDSCISFKNEDRLLADFFLVVLFGNLFGTFPISSNVVIIPDYSDFFILEYRYFKQALNPLIVYIWIYDLQIRLVVLSFIKLANRIVWL